MFIKDYTQKLGKTFSYSLLVVEGGQIEHFDKVTEEEQPAMNRYCYCNNAITDGCVAPLAILLTIVILYHKILSFY